jgi:hypothetical protein
MHSEEHLVVETLHAREFRVGDALYGVPRNICPTVALHIHVVVVRDARAAERWAVVAHNRVLTIDVPQNGEWRRLGGAYGPRQRPWWGTC